MGDSNQKPSEAEIELRQQLDRAKADFEEFISMATHNLRQSLRDIASYSQLMSETYATRLDADAGMFLARIQTGAASMESLLADMVQFWATTNGEVNSSRTDMDAALVQALLFAEKQIAERRAAVTNDPLPPVTGDFRTLAKVLHHLIKNAIQYCVVDTPGIHISSKRTGRDWVFSVRDNGPGIEPVFHRRIFQAFKRLHGNENPGNGLGLAFCKKAVESYGGRIWVESIPGEGSTFFFTVPADE